MSEQEISKATIGRMPLYLHFLPGGEFKGGEIHFFGGNCTKYSRIGGACAERSGDRIVAPGASAF